MGEQFIAFKIWDTSGRILYSTNSESTGDTFAIKDELASALRGQVVTELTNLDDEENRIERQVVNRSIEVYTPVHELGSGRVIAVAEFYQRIDGLEVEIASSRWRSWLVFGAVATLMILLLYLLVRSANRTIEEQRAALEEQVGVLRNILAQNKVLHRRVRNGAAQTSALNERTLRRIGSELHDGPIQHLSLALLHIEGIRQTNAADNLSGASQLDSSIEVVKTSLSKSLQEMRAIASGMGLPELGPLTLGEALKRVVRTHERQTQTSVSLGLNNVDVPVALPVKIAVYRVVQEALNNAFRHASGLGQEVFAERLSESELYLEISDQGPGIDPAQTSEAAAQGHMGMFGMRERIESLGGVFSVVQRPIGVSIRAWLPLLIDAPAA
ncbi:MAG: sensor histidine kinase [Chloroflexi bacterium]|nr:sensor histidine kinase [Chloroflexota bacterium]